MAKVDTAALFVLLYELVESTAAAAFFHPVANAFAFIIALALYGKYLLDKGNPYIKNGRGWK